MERDQRIRPVAAIAGADRAGRPARLRLRVGSRASLPGGIFALLRARGVPCRGQPAHQDHPSWPRHHPAHHQSAAPGGREGGDARPAVGRAGGVRHGRGRRAGRAAPVQHPGARQARAVGGGGARHHPDVHPHVLGIPRPVPTTFPPATWCRSRCRSRIRRCGWRAPTSRPSARPGNGAWARWVSASSRRTRRRPGCTATTTTSCTGRTGWASTRPIPTSRSSTASCARRPTRRRSSLPRAGPFSFSPCRIMAARGSMRPAPAICGTSTRTGARPSRRSWRCATG